MRKLTILEGSLALLVAVVGFIVYFLMSQSTAAGNAVAGTSNVTSNATNMVAGGAYGIDNSSVLSSSHWGVSGIGSVSNIYLAGNDTLYAFTGDYGNAVYAMDPAGKVRWKYTLSDEWHAINEFTHPTPLTHQDGNQLGWPSYTGPVFSSDNGTLYLYARENRTNAQNNRDNAISPIGPQANDWMMEERLLAISREGKLLWDIQISPEHHFFKDTGIYAKNGRVYVFDDYSLMVLDSNGSELFKIADVASQAAVDENGFIYVVPAILCDPQPSLITDIYKDAGYREPSNMVRAYYPNGTMRWERQIGQEIIRPDLRDQFDPLYYTLPLYRNGTLYLPISNGLQAMGTDGSLLWAKHYDRADLFWAMPVDSCGNAYVCDSPIGQKPTIHIISPDGTEIVRDQKTGETFGDPAIKGLLFSAEQYSPDPSVKVYWNSLDFMVGENITAYDLVNDTTLWNYTIIPDKKYTTITSDNIARILSVKALQDMARGNVYVGDSGVYPDTNENYPAHIIPGDKVVIVTYQVANVEWPVVIGRSNCSYASDMYVFDKKNGTLLYNVSMDSRITSATVNNNSTIYYGTKDGKVIAQQIGSVAGGITLAALSYLFIRFVCLGTISRARGRIGKNENRNRIWDCIEKWPGLTLFEISQAVNMNVGTVRYHLFILNLNHRIISYRADGKYVRYFANSASYNPEDRLIISLMRRENVKRILALLIERQSLSNLELSNELKLYGSAISRYIKELMDKGVIVKESTGGTSAYAIKKEHRAAVISACERLRIQEHTVGFSIEPSQDGLKR